MPKRTSKFSVNPQEAQENQPPNGYNTQPTFSVPGTSAAKRRRQTLAPLAPFADTNPASEGYSYGSPQTYYGLMTPETPSNNVSQAYFPHDHENGIWTPFPSKQGQNLEEDYSFQQNSNQPLGANLLFTAPNLSHQAPIHSPNMFPTDNELWDRQQAFDFHLQSFDCMDHDAISPDLSPLIFERHAALPPDFLREREIDAVIEDLPLEAHPRKRRKSISKSETVVTVHEILREASLTPTQFLINILEAAEEGSSNARIGKAFFRQTNAANITHLLDLIMANRKGASILKEWMRPHAITLVCDTIHDEMESAKPYLRMTTAETSPEFVESWDINKIMDPVSRDITPTWSAVLIAATDPKSSHIQPDELDAENIPQCRHTTQNIISAQAHYRRSFKSSKVQTGLGLMAWSTGASRSLLNVLHKAGLANSYRSITKTIFSLHESSVEEAEKVSHEPHALSYDNVNFSTSKHIEQRPGAMSKVQSGTFPVIYKLEGVDPKHMKLSPLIENLKISQPLTISDLRPTQISAQMYTHQSSVNISKILFKYSTEFDDVANDTLLQHKVRRAIPKGQKTCFYPLSVSTIEEATVTGNLHVHDNVYIDQLHHDPQKLNDNAIPCLNDQLTNARIRGAQSLRAKDVNSWERREIFQLAFGTFHLVMNLIWGLLHIHRGTALEHGSLSHYFSLLEKARLGNDKPEFYTLLAALTQILDGLILNAWRTECGHPSLDAFAASKPTPEDIASISRKIFTKYATPKHPRVRTEAPSKKRKTPGDQPDNEATPQPPPYVDSVHSNTILLTRDLLYVIELVSAISTGDFGRVEDILPQIACIFRGAGSNNYSMEVLHLLFNIKEVWTSEFADIMRDIMLVNPSGLDGHSMAIDMNIEHLIGYLKTLFAAKGLYSNWGRLGNISAGINYLQLIKKRVATSLGSGYQGSTHTTPNTNMLVFRVANRARELNVQKYMEHRDVQSKLVPDLHYVGYRKFETASLAMFNKKINEYKLGCNFESDEADELPPPNFTDTTVTEEGESFLLE